MINIDIKKDSAFKNVFLREEGRLYMCSIISKLYGLDYNGLVSNLKVHDTEHPRLNTNTKSSYSDIIYEYKNKLFIIEMNYRYLEKSIHKNHFYLLFKHIFDANNKNNYNMNKETYLIDIDNYDIKEEIGLGNSRMFVTHGRLIIEEDNLCIYKNIKTTRINLDYLRRKVYNDDMLRDIEEDCLIFVERNKEKLKERSNYKKIEGVIKVLEMIEQDGKYYPVYNKEEWEESLREEIRERSLKQGIEKGIEKGMKRGIERGMERGIKQGYKNANISLAEKLLNKNYPKEEIIELTGITNKEFDKILQKTTKQY